MDEPVLAKLTSQYSGHDGPPLNSWCEVPEAATDRARDSEFHSYYEPFKAAVANGDKSRKDGVLLSGEDRALTAFAQLGALRLGARRCAISFFDQDTQYVLAEATKTLSLQTDEPDIPEDSLLWGVAEFPLNAGLCQYTIRLPPEYVQSDDGHLTEVAINCFPDMSADPRFQDLPFVCGTPYTRFYAAVPIRSPTGLALGSYCVMGDEPKAGLTHSEIAFLKDMATTVMVHLEMVRAREEIRRNALVIHGLGSFVEGESSIWGGRRVADESLDHGYTGSKWYEQQYAIQRPGLLKTGQAPKRVTPKDPSLTQDFVEQYPKNTTPEHSPTRLSAERTMSTTNLSIELSQTTNRQHQLQSLDIRHTFARAASIIRECTDVDGVVLYDASIGTFGGMVDLESETDSTLSLDSKSTADEPSDSENGSNDSDRPTNKRQPYEEEDYSKRCRILGFATPRKSDLHKDEPPEHLTNMTEKLLRRLLKRHPFGRVFNFDEMASPTIDAQDDSPVYRTRSRGRQERKHKRLHRNDVKAIRAILPDVRSMMLVPFYDINRKSNYAGGIVWSKNSQRVFSQEQALTYLAAFADSVMAEVARIEAKIAERTKSDFISSISHELRSPLHGILGGVECLQDTNDPSMRAELLYTVETCGKTLLDTIDHLLEFTKINNFSKAPNGKLRSSTGELSRLSLDAKSGGAMDALRQEPTRRSSVGLETDVDLATLTEEVVHTVRAGNAYVRAAAPTDDSSGASNPDISIPPIRSRPGAVLALSSSSAPATTVEIIIDIDKSESADWLYRTQPGAWRRIVMNLFGNAIKYTAKGHVRVSLRTSPFIEDELGEVVLTVSDTGRGISRDFQETKLFTPFAQEDYLAPGTGLGLSIIKQVVTEMGGKIAVRSEQGQGTVVEVRLTLERSAKRPIEETWPSVTMGRAFSSPMFSFASPAYSTEEPLTIAATPPPSISGVRVEDVVKRPPLAHPVAQKLHADAKRVLIVDDNDINVRLLVTYMKKQGHQYRTASNGLEALEIFQAVTTTAVQGPQHSVSMPDLAEDKHAATATPLTVFDYVLMDISMPVMDGLESTRCIRAHERELVSKRRADGLPYAPTTIIALTGLASTETRQEAYSSGIDRFMPKPVKLAELKKVMAAANNT
ncbi:hypothetical protein LTR78_010079 [Recurvomyces mirabilis]|uniref:histidine kinase n=1 Tax=Recurvomyces mirabilis TaxID=574656 RepID=A0AAE0TMT5_9PEZI|nr:hypothetical protein LTR78_010079 [Recurvomyces mirabilis]